MRICLYKKDSQLKNISDYLTIVLNLCEGVSVLHKNNIVHGDIKMDNMVLKKKGYLIDFGSS